MRRTAFSGGDEEAGAYASPMSPTREELEEFASYREAFFCDDDAYREAGEPLEDPERAEEEYDGLEDGRDFWWGGFSYCLRDEDGEIVQAGCMLLHAAERKVRRQVVLMECLHQSSSFITLFNSRPTTAAIFGTICPAHPRKPTVRKCRAQISGVFLFHESEIRKAVVVRCGPSQAP